MSWEGIISINSRIYTLSPASAPISKHNLLLINFQTFYGGFLQNILISSKSNLCQQYTNVCVILRMFLHEHVKFHCDVNMFFKRILKQYYSLLPIPFSKNQRRNFYWKSHISFLIKFRLDWLFLYPLLVVLDRTNTTSWVTMLFVTVFWSLNKCSKLSSVHFVSS